MINDLLALIRWEKKLSLRGNFTPFISIFWNIRPLLSMNFPQGLRISKNIGLLTSGSGGKNTFKRYLKSEHTETPIGRQTHIWTYIDL